MHIPATATTTTTATVTATIATMGQQHSFGARCLLGSTISCPCKLFVDNFVCYKSPRATVKASNQPTNQVTI